MLQSTGDHFEGALAAPPATPDPAASGLPQRLFRRVPISQRLSRLWEPNAQRGMTGIETAIIMISFIIVASVFAMTTLNIGLFADDETESTVQGGLKRASVSMWFEAAYLPAEAPWTSMATKLS